ATRELQAKSGRAPIDAEVACWLKLSKEKSLIIRQALDAQKAAFRANLDENESFPDEQLADYRTSAPDSHLVHAEQLQRALAYLERLAPREAAVLRMRFGLEGHDPMTLMAISVRLGVTRERVRQIEQAALTKLREMMQAN